MKREHRGGIPLAGLIVAAILLACTAGYVSALTRMFQPPMIVEQTESDFLSEADADAPAAKAPGISFQQTMGRMAAIWLMNAFPAQSSSSARANYYFSLDRAGDPRFLELAPVVASSSYSGTHAVFTPSLPGKLAPSPVLVRQAEAGPPLPPSTLPPEPVPDGPLTTNTTNNYTGTTTGSVLTGTNWSLGHVPTVSEDAVFPVGATTGIRTFSNGSLTVGSFDVLATTGTFTLRNGTSGTTSTLTLGGAGDLGNGVSGTASDLLFATAGSTFVITGTNGTAILNTVLGQSGSFNAAGTMTISSVISDGGNNFGITKTGAGTLTLSGANTFGGGLTLSTGTLNINNASALGIGTFTINGGTIANSTNAGLTLTTNNAQTWGGDFTVSVSGSGGAGDLNLGTGAVLLTGNRTILNISGSSTFTVGGVISDGGNGYTLTRAGNGTGTWVLAGNSTYSGGTTLGAGTTSVSNLGNAGASGNLGTGNISLGNGSTSATLLYTGAGETTNKVFNLSGTTGGGIIDTTGATGGLILSADLTATGAGTKTLTIRGNTTGNTISGKIVDNLSGTNNTSVSKTGTGTWTLSGANTYTGNTTITDGTLSVSTISDSGVSSNVGAGTTINFGSSATTGTLLYTGTGDTTNKVINLNGTTGGAIIDQSGTSGLLKFTGTNTAAGLGNKSLTLQGSTAGTGEIGGAIVDSTGFATSLTKTGAGTWTLSGINSYSGGTNVNAGILKLSGTGTLGSISGTLTMGGGTLDLNGTNQNVGALNGSSGTILNEAPSGGGGAKTLTIGNGDTSGSFSGTITDHDGSGSGFVKLIKTGTGTETMTSTTSNYTGGTDINGGTLISNSANGGALGRGPVTVNNSGTTLVGNGLIDADVTVSSAGNPGGTLAVGTTSASGNIGKVQIGQSAGLGALTLAAGSNLLLDLTAGAGLTGTGAGTIYDQVSALTSVTLGGGTLTLNVGPGLAVGDKFYIVLNNSANAVNGTFSGLAEGSTFTQGGDTFLISYLDSGGDGTLLNDISLTVTAIPEPSTWGAAALAFLVVGYMQRKRFAKRLRVIG